MCCRLRIIPMKDRGTGQLRMPKGSGSSRSHCSEHRHLKQMRLCSERQKEWKHIGWVRCWTDHVQTVPLGPQVMTHVVTNLGDRGGPTSTRLALISEVSWDCLQGIFCGAMNVDVLKEEHTRFTSLWRHTRMTNQISNLMSMAFQNKGHVLWLRT